MMIGLKGMSRFTRVASASIWILCLLLPMMVKAQGASIWGQALSATGKPAAFATLRICPITGGGIPCSPLSSVFSDLALTQPVGNPYTSDQNGNFSVFVAAGAAYIVQLAVAPSTVYSYLVTAAPISGTGSVTSVGLSMPGIFSVGNSPITSTGVLAVTLNAQAANQFFAGPCSGASIAPTFRVLCSADSTAALAADPNFAWNVATLNSATINNAGTITTGNLITKGNLAYHTDCSSNGNFSFAFGFISNGEWGGPVIAQVTGAPNCPAPSDYVLGPFATGGIAIEQGANLFFSNCGLNIDCSTVGPGLSSTVNAGTPPTIGSACPNAPFPGPTGQPSWIFGNDLHIYVCSNAASSVWARLI